MTTPAPSNHTMPNIIAKYTGMIDLINSRVLEFNLFLAQEHRLKLIDPNDDSTFSILGDVPWESQHWPSDGYAGMYVLGGYDQQHPARLGAYFGRASFQNMGSSIRDHLRPGRSAEAYTLQGGPVVFRIEVVMAVPIISPTMRSMAHALEEHAVKYSFGDIYVMNNIGTRPTV